MLAARILLVIAILNLLFLISEMALNVLGIALPALGLLGGG